MLSFGLTDYILQHEDLMGECMYKSHCLQVSNQLHCLGCFTPKERAPGIHYIGGLVDSRICRDNIEK
jgi:hypothetical protein